MDDPLNILALLLEKAGVKVTFSINCCSGIVHILGPGIPCECWRCRQKRGEPHNEETEAYAKTISQLAQKKFREQQKQYWKSEPSDGGTMIFRSIE